MVFALCGGDERIARLASMLVEDGHGVRAWALEDAPLAEGVRECASADECISGAHCVVLPMPLTARRGFLNAPFSKKPRCLGEVFTAVRPGSLVCAGGVTAEARELAEECGARLADYGALESFRAVNSLATAEGAIGVLSPRLAALGVRVSVASRSAAGRAWAQAMGFRALDTAKLSGALGGADMVINTAPALVLTASRLTELPAGALVLDLASKPGGTDFDAARSFGIKAPTAPGLPGKWSPDTAAKAVRDAIYAVLEDE